MTGEALWLSYCQASGISTDTPHDTWKFCGGGPAADELADLVLAGIKTATASAMIAYRTEGEPIPKVGCLSVVLFDNDEAACIIRDTKVSVVPFDEVSPAHAFREGEDDRSLEKWREVHLRFFTPDYEAAGLPFDRHGDCVLEEFEVVYRPPLYRPVDMAAYPRKTHFDYFRTMANPYVGTTVQVDVTALKDRCKARGISFFLMFLHAAALAADDIPQFRQRIRGDSIVEYSRCGTSHTESMPDGTYVYCTLNHHLPLETYLREAKAAQEASRQQSGLSEDENSEGLYFISCLPWLSYTALIQPTGDDSNPRITWGKYTQDAAGRWIMPVTVLCHHALVDGRQLGQFYQLLEQQMARLVQPD